YFTTLFNILNCAAEWNSDGNQSHIDWNDLRDETWTDLNLWKVNLQKTKDDPQWRMKKKKVEYSKTVGKIIACFGDCRIYRGQGFSQALYRSSIREGDEIKTMGESYLWLFLLDG